MRGDHKTTPAPITAPVVHYEGQKLRLVLWLLVAIEAIGVVIDIIK